MKRKHVKITIADILFDLNYEAAVEISEKFRPFIKEQGENIYHIYFSKVKKLPEISGTVLMNTLEYQVILTAQGMKKVFHDNTDQGNIYAIATYDRVNRYVQIDYLQEKEKYFSESGNSFFHVGWESILMKEGRMVLHAACVNTPCGGLLFSGPSGIGKSTQADLWCRYNEGFLINGDRPILCKKNGIWNAYGSPYAGSSNCHIDTHCQIRAIVFLLQSSECRIKRLDVGQAFRKIYEETTINNWDAQYVSKVCDLITELLQDIPVYEMACTPDRQATELLKRILIEGEQT